MWRSFSDGHALFRFIGGVVGVMRLQTDRTVVSDHRHLGAGVFTNGDENRGMTNTQKKWPLAR